MASKTMGPKFHPAANLFPLLTGTEFESLKRDIEHHGLREPIVMLEGQILDGRNRYRACVEVGVEPRFREWTPAESDTPWAFVKSENLERRHMDESQRSMCAGRLANLEGKGRPSKNASIGAISQEQAADELRVARSSVQRAVIVLNEGSESLIQAVDQGKLAVSEAAIFAREFDEATQTEIARLALDPPHPAKARDTIDRRVDELRRSARIAYQVAPTPLDKSLGRFNLIYADPPWRYEHSPSDRRRIENQYPTLSLDEICALPVPTLAADDCVLFLWATAPKLAEAMQVIEAWGFSYRTGLVWDKERAQPGQWVQTQQKHLVFTKRGEPPRPVVEARPVSLFRAPRQAIHSAKPLLVYDLIEAMFPEFRKLELFARNTRPGWVSWGNEVTKQSDN